MATFSHLPIELVEYIVVYLPQPNLSALSQTNKSLRALALPLLYRHVDLFIPPGNNLPRIDRFCLNIINEARLASRVETLRVGLSPHDSVTEGQRWLPPDKHFDDNLMFKKAMETFDNETLVAVGDYLRDAISMREYSAYAALILLILPNLQQLEVADYSCATLDHVHNLLRNLDGGARWNIRQPSQDLINRLSTIKKISLNFDRLSGLAYLKDPSRSTLDYILNLPGITTLEFSLSEGQESGLTYPPGHPSWPHRQLINLIRPTNITTLVIRHSGPLQQNLTSLLECTPQLKSLTYAIFYNCKARDPSDQRLIDLAAWNEVLNPVKSSLDTLILSIEYCNTESFSFEQPRIGERFFGYLDLTNFTNLHTLEVPFPFLTGDAEFSITTEIYPLFPPNLRHLSLRPDLSHAQFSFPLDTSILAVALSYLESEMEARHLMNARMDVSYMFHATLALLDFAPGLQTLTVWQPADPSMNWFEGQVSDFRTTCKNRLITGKILYPMLLRWKNTCHWNLIKEVTVFDRTLPSQGILETLHRDMCAGVPLGLASQYHLHALRSHQVKTRR